MPVVFWVYWIFRTLAYTYFIYMYLVNLLPGVTGVLLLTWWVSTYLLDDVYDEGEETTLKGAEPTASGGYRLRLPIPSVFFKYVIGKEGRTKASIERETGCRLGIPGIGREGDISEP